MITNYLGLNLSYEALFNLSGTRSFGTPFRHIERLRQEGLYIEIQHLGLSEIRTYLEEGIPVLVGVHTADLSYWTQGVDHVVIVVRSDDSFVYVNDPSLAQGQHPIPVIEFELAQLDFDNLCAIIRK